MLTDYIPLKSARSCDPPAGIWPYNGLFVDLTQNCNSAMRAGLIMITYVKIGYVPKALHLRTFSA